MVVIITSILIFVSTNIDKIPSYNLRSTELFQYGLQHSFPDAIHE